MRPEIGDHVVEGSVGRHLAEVLPVVGDPHRVRDPDLPGVHRALAGDRFQQRGLAGAVGPHETDDVAAAHRDVEVADQRPPADGERHVLQDQRLVATPLGDVEAE